MESFYVSSGQPEYPALNIVTFEGGKYNNQPGYAG